MFLTVFPPCPAPVLSPARRCIQCGKSPRLPRAQHTAGRRQARPARQGGACMRMGDADERAVEIGRYIVRSGATVRATAAVFGVSKSTVWKDQTRLRRQSPALWREVQQVLQKNKAERHLRGGEATRQKFLRQNALHPPDLPAEKSCAGPAQTV